jgi:hypothetical protein
VAGSVLGYPPWKLPRELPRVRVRAAPRGGRRRTRSESPTATRAAREKRSTGGAGWGGPRRWRRRCAGERASEEEEGLGGRREPRKRERSLEDGPGRKQRTGRRPTASASPVPGAVRGREPRSGVDRTPRGNDKLILAPMPAFEINESRATTHCCSSGSTLHCWFVACLLLVPLLVRCALQKCFRPSIILFYTTASRCPYLHAALLPPSLDTFITFSWLFISNCWLFAQLFTLALTLTMFGTMLSDRAAIGTLLHDYFIATPNQTLPQSYTFL